MAAILTISATTRGHAFLAATTTMAATGADVITGGIAHTLDRRSARGGPPGRQPGNNIILVGDITRRAQISTMDAKLERRKLRTFKVDPFKQVLENRARYIAAALTIVHLEGSH